MQMYDYKRLLLFYSSWIITNAVRYTYLPTLPYNNLFQSLVFIQHGKDREKYTLRLLFFCYKFFFFFFSFESTIVYSDIIISAHQRSVSNFLMPTSHVPTGKDIFLWCKYQKIDSYYFTIIKIIPAGHYQEKWWREPYLSKFLFLKKNKIK